MSYCTEPCCTDRPTQMVTSEVTSWQGPLGKDRWQVKAWYSDPYCTTHAASAVKVIEGAAGVELISVVALPPVEVKPYPKGYAEGVVKAFNANRLPDGANTDVDDSFPQWHEFM